VWFGEPVDQDEVTFDPDVFLLRKKKATELKKPIIVSPPQPEPQPGPEPETGLGPGPGPDKGEQTRTLRVAGSIPPEVWSRFGAKLIPKLRFGEDLKIGVELQLRVDAKQAQTLIADLQQILNDLGLTKDVKIE
jgi:hypothetical protein